MPASPSLLIVPARFKTGKLYTQIATTSAGVILASSGDFTVTRNTEARRFTSAGLIESVASGIPRLDYYTSGGTAGCPALLVEPAATNLVFHSEVWAAGSNWNLSAGSTPRVTRVTGSTDAFKAPDGTFTANALSPTSGNVSHQLFSNSPTEITYTSGTIYTQSAFFKAGTGDAGRYVQLTFGSPQFTQVGYANFDLQVGAVVASGGTADANRNARVENYGNGWYRCAFTATCNASGTTNGVFAALITASGATRAPSFSGTVTDVLYGWGAQVETGSVATSYIPTTAGTGSRSGDLVSATGAVSGSIGQTAGTFYLDLTYSLRLTSTATRWIQIFGSSNNIGLAVATTNIVRSIVNGQSDILSTPSTADGVKIAWGYDGSGVVCFVNGTQYTLTNGGAQIITQLNQISLDLSTTNAIGNCRLRAMALYTTRLTNAELAAMTQL